MDGVAVTTLEEVLVPLVTSQKADSQKWASKGSNGWTVIISGVTVHSLFPNCSNCSKSKQWKSECARKKHKLKNEDKNLDFIFFAV